MTKRTHFWTVWKKEQKKEDKKVKNIVACSIKKGTFEKYTQLN